MGVSRGLKNKLNYTVVSLEGEILSSGPVGSTGQCRSSSGIRINELHASANFIADTAAFYKAQVIVQNLTRMGDGLSWIEEGQDQCSPEYKRKDYNRLTRLLDYKLPWKDLPPPIRTSAVDIFYSCWNCGLNTRKNRLSKDFFICTGCGTAMEIDRLGSLNLAGKLIRYNASKIKIEISRTEEGVIFTNKLLGLDCFSSYRENQLERLKTEIQKIIEDSTDPADISGKRAQAGRMSLIKKLKSAGNFMDLLEYIE